MLTPIKPMLAIPSTGAGNRRPVNLKSLMDTGLWAADLKLDGVRVILYWDGHDVKLVNRNMVDVTHRFPEVAADAKALGRKPLVLDGEVCAADGSFESIAIRDRQTQPADVARAMARMPAHFLAFDVLHHGGRDYLSVP
jgi:bifunctional non-homologous end joining protein LigD